MAPEGEREASAAGRRRLIVNPTSGRGKHVEEARRLAGERGFDVVETEYGGHAVELAEAAASDGVDLLGVCGGDGTLHEVLAGLDDCGALDDVTLAVVPAGTENLVAGYLGIDSLEAAFEVAVGGDRRRVDLAVADGEPFLLSAILGLPAEASVNADHDLKRAVGPVAFLVSGVREAVEFDALSVVVDAHGPEGDESWAGEALAVLVGNVRHFSRDGGQANVEDGRLDVTVVESMPARDAAVEAIEQRLLEWNTEHVRDFQASALAVTVNGDGVTCSLDGEAKTVEGVAFEVRPRALRLAVGDSYEPDPD